MTDKPDSGSRAPAESLMVLVACSQLMRHPKYYRAVVADRATDSEVWHCADRHRTAEAAQRCAERHIREVSAARRYEDGKPQLTKEDWIVMWRQVDAVRAFWQQRMATDPAPSICGVAWLADYGPLFCNKPHGHNGAHRCYGSHGLIQFTGRGK